MLSYTHHLQSLHFLFVLQEISGSQPSSRFAHIKRSHANIHVENSCISVGTSGLYGEMEKKNGREKNNGTGQNAASVQSNGVAGEANESSSDNDTCIATVNEVGDHLTASFIYLLLPPSIGHIHLKAST